MLFFLLLAKLESFSFSASAHHSEPSLSGIQGCLQLHHNGRTGRAAGRNEGEPPGLSQPLKALKSPAVCNGWAGSCFFAHICGCYFCFYSVWLAPPNEKFHNFLSIFAIFFLQVRSCWRFLRNTHVFCILQIFCYLPPEVVFHQFCVFLRPFGSFGFGRWNDLFICKW